MGRKYKEKDRKWKERREEEHTWERRKKGKWKNKRRRIRKRRRRGVLAVNHRETFVFNTPSAEIKRPQQSLCCVWTYIRPSSPPQPTSLTNHRTLPPTKTFILVLHILDSWPGRRMKRMKRRERRPEGAWTLRGGYKYMSFSVRRGCPAERRALYSSKHNSVWL